ncbi:hypothetical protein JCM21900_003796 [Sporobolomyces salmonicolor]
MPPHSTLITPLSLTLPASTGTACKLSLPFPPFSSGSWTLSFIEAPVKCAPTMACVPTVATLRMEWSGCEEGVEVWGGSLRFVRKEKGKGEERADVRVEKGRFPPERDGSIKVARFVPCSKDNTVEVELELEVVPKEEATAVSRTLELLNDPQSLDLCLVFPREGRKLWASSKALAELSPYWKTQLSSSGFREDVDNKEGSSEMEGTSDDSDDELDNDRSSRPRTLADSPPPPPGTRTIPITGTLYNTYRALLCWLYTSQVQFAPLTSAFLRTPASEAAADLPNSPSPCPAAPAWPSAPLLCSARRARHSALSARSLLAPSAPPAVSPKSLYRLAHFLEIPALAALCVSALRDLLTVDNVPHEMLGSLAEVYDEVWDAEVQWARERWDQVRDGAGMRVEGERMRTEGATAHEAATLLRLCGIREG